MFTGLIEQVGRIQSFTPDRDGASLRVEARFAPELIRGESVAVDGVCLTVESTTPSAFAAFASGETLRRTTLGDLRSGAEVNLERALRMGDRLGGHWVQGHVDTTGRLARVEPAGASRIVVFTAPPSVRRQFVEKGSVAIDGISLTVASLDDDTFSVWVIPETWDATTLGRKRPGDPVNVECDLIAKYVFRYLETLAGEETDPRARDAALSALLRQGGWGQRQPSRDR